MNKTNIQLLVGDNAFHGISHLSQQRARDRHNNPATLDTASQLVRTSLENGANGFMFSVSETTLGILKTLRDKPLVLYPIVPYAYEYVRLATKVGGIPGLSKKVSKEVVFSKSLFKIIPNVFGLLGARPVNFLNTYLIYELSRIKSAAGKNANVRSVLLHEVITDMALALDLQWFFESYIDFFKDRKMRPGFETRNFPLLVKKFSEWGLESSNITLCAAFNKIGFQMNPSKKHCEQALETYGSYEVIAMSILAAGYLKLPEAVDYILSLNHLGGIVAGVSKESHAVQTFSLLSSKLKK